MDYTKILETLITELNAQCCWFSSKQDLTYREPDRYYELDEYGDLTEEAAQQVVAEIVDLIGNGALDTQDAIEIWIQDAVDNYTVTYNDTIRTQYKAKPIVDQIDAFQVADINPATDIPGVVTLVEDKVIDEACNKLEDEPVADAAKKTRYDECVSAYTEICSKDEQEGNVFLRVKAIQFGLDRSLLDTETSESVLDKIATAYADDVVKNEAKSHKNEASKKLYERNTKSLDLISDMIVSPNFDSDSAYGKIILRTSNLFNTLSDANYDVEVSFDNGDSESVIQLGKEGGKVVITMNDATSPLKAYLSGNMEISTESLRTLDDIFQIINSFK